MSDDDFGTFLYLSYPTRLGDSSTMVESTPHV